MSNSKPQLGALTREQIHQAFDKASKYTKIHEDGELFLVTEELHAAVKRFGTDNFVPNEPINAALGCDKESPDWDRVWNQSLKFNMSVALINKHAGDIMAMLTIGITRADETSDLETFTNKNIKEFIRLVLKCHKEGHIYEHYGMSEVIHFKQLAVGEKYRHLGIGSRLVEAAVTFVACLGVYPIGIKVTCSSKFSKRIFEKNGFEALSEILYDDYMVDGKRIVCNTGIHTSIILYGKYIKSGF